MTSMTGIIIQSTGHEQRVRNFSIMNVSLLSVLMDTKEDLEIPLQDGG